MICSGWFSFCFAFRTRPQGESSLCSLRFCASTFSNSCLQFWRKRRWSQESSWTVYRVQVASIDSQAWCLTSSCVSDSCLVICKRCCTSASTALSLSLSCWSWGLIPSFAGGSGTRQASITTKRLVLRLHVPPASSYSHTTNLSSDVLEVTDMKLVLPLSYAWSLWNRGSTAHGSEVVADYDGQLRRTCLLSGWRWRGQRRSCLAWSPCVEGLLA